MNDITLISVFIFIDLLCLNIFMILRLSEHKSNKKDKTKRELIKFHI